MNKIKNIFLLITLGVVLISSCGDTNNGFVNPFADVNYEELALKDNDSLIKFLKNNYYDYSLDSVKTLTTGKTSLFDETSKLKSIDVIDNDIKHTLYIYVVSEGMPSPIKGNPTTMDSTFVKYSGQAFYNSELQDSSFDSNRNEEGNWFTLSSVVRGWAHGFTILKGGENITNNGPITYKNTGKAVLFIPSGLGYPSSNANNYNSNLVNTNLMFYVELLDIVEDTDHDNDGVPSINEDADGDGDPRNDFSDTSNPGLPDYLNPNIK